MGAEQLGLNPNPDGSEAFRATQDITEGGADHLLQLEWRSDAPCE